jgi:hypothetical protein
MIEVSSFEGIQQSRRLPSHLMTETDIQFPKRYVPKFLEYQMMNKVKEPSNSELIKDSVRY